MSILKKLFVFCFLVISVFCSYADTWTDPETGIVWTYTATDGVVSIGSGGSTPAVPTSTEGEIEIPSEINGFPVRTISSYAFYACSDLIEVKVPNGVTNISYGAFWGCSSLQKVSLPESIAYIGAWAFCNCRALTHISIPNGVNHIGAGAFCACTSFSSVSLPETLSYLGAEAFRDCVQLKEIKFLGNPKVVGCGVFYNCMSLTNAVIGAEGELSNIYCPGSDPTPPYVFGGGVAAVSFRTNGVFEGCTALQSVTMSNTITNIGPRAFYGCSSLTDIEWPDDLLVIKEHAFAQCTSLAKVVIPETAKIVSYGAFYNCSSLTNVVVEEGVEDLGVFYSVSSTASSSGSSTSGTASSAGGNLLGGSTSGSGSTPIGDDAVGSIVVTNEYDSVLITEGVFEGCTSLVHIAIPSTVKNISRRAFYGCSALDDSIIPNHIESIGTGAFYGCSAFKELILPNSVTNMLQFAFAECGSLTKVLLPERLSQIRHGTFSGCASLGDIEIPHRVQSIANAAFYDCSSLTNIVFGDGLKLLGQIEPPENPFENNTNSQSSGTGGVLLGGGRGVFEACVSLHSVSVPDGVTNIGLNAFKNCTSLAKVLIPDTVTTLNSTAFTGCSSIIDLTMPCNLLWNYNITDLFPSCILNKLNRLCLTGDTSIVPAQDFMDLTSLRELEIGEGVISIEPCAFNNLTSLEKVTLPSTLTLIGEEAFYGCGSLDSVVFRGDAPDVGANAFFGTPKRMVVSVAEDTIGWDGGFTSTLPSSWQGRQIVNYTSDSESGGVVDPIVPGGGDVTSTSNAYSLTVTNVVVHYVLNSIQPEIAVPLTNSVGLVNVITEVKSGGAVSVPTEWKDNFDGFEEKYGSDFGKALMKPTGKVDAVGNAMLVWQDYVVGTNPMDVNDVLTATVTIVDGRPVISWTPELSAEQVALRVYTVYGKANLQDADWTAVDGDEEKYNFFKVTVEMK